MRIAWQIIMLWVLFTPNLNGQDIIRMPLEELEREGSNWDLTDTVRRVDILNEIVYRYRNDFSRTDSLRELVQDAHNLAVAIHYLEGIGDAYVRSGLLETKSGNLTIAIESYKQALTIRADSLKNYLQAAGVYNNLGLLYKKQKDSLRQSVNSFQKGLFVIQQVDDGKAKSRSKGRLMNNLGDVLTILGNFEEAQLYLDSSLQIRIGLEDSGGMAYTYLNLALLHKKLLNLEQYGTHLSNALALFHEKNDAYGLGKVLLGLGDYSSIISNYNKAIDYYDQALNYVDALDADDTGYLFQNRGIAYLYLGQKEKVLENYQTGLQFFEKANHDQGKATLYYNLGSFFYEQQQFQPAVQYFKKGVGLMGLNSDIATKMNGYYYLGESYKALGIQDSAMQYISFYAQFKDSVSNSYRDAMNTRYNLAVAENEIKQLQIERVEENQKKMETYGLIGFGVSWLLLGLATMGYYLSRQRRKLAEKNIQLSQQQVIELIQEKELETNYAWMNGVETTRKKIGEELHDSIGSMLSIVKVYFSSLDNKMNTIQQDNREKYAKANHLLDEACEKVRKLSHEMTSAILVKFGLNNQLETLAETLRDSGQLKVELTTYGLKKRLGTQTEFNIYRIIQELVSNVIKHAKAEKISIQVNSFEEMVNIMVEDNGIGFDVKEARRNGGIGLKNVASRVHELEGTIDFDSSEGKGTSITIDIPIMSN